MERKWIVVAFGDIHGFKAWRYRAMNAPEVSDPFIQNFYMEIEKFVNVNVTHDKQIKYLGDGLMILKELESSEKASGNMHNFLKMAGHLNTQLLNIVKTCKWPAPNGFRMRIVAGHVSKLEMPDPQDFNRQVWEYIGYPMNLAHAILQVSPKIPLICHESVINILGDNKKGMIFKKLVKSRINQRGLDAEDIDSLWQLEFKPDHEGDVKP